MSEGPFSIEAGQMTWPFIWIFLKKMILPKDQNKDQVEEFKNFQHLQGSR